MENVEYYNSCGMEGIGKCKDYVKFKLQKGKRMFSEKRGLQQREVYGKIIKLHNRMYDLLCYAAVVHR